ncbi:hypothetical protein GCM10023190_25420 [Enteractinococcus fodinae]|jgi:hypothetical protein|uniref:DUF3263 domain-containing protein n=1 Tax=Enteractinococcus fodinae TaxID=684663 RepID=A0ABU2B263_9MICC|nr:DUF3263 domain-containing protein [Enteractinococcus fodinae]MDR7347693.1 hypothetical protein [Enteractinococcus fodinae]
MAALSAIDQQMLEFEKRSWHYAGAKDRDITDTFGMTPTRYYHKLARLITTERAYAYDPMLVERLLNARSTVQRVEGMTP